GPSPPWSQPVGRAPPANREPQRRHQEGREHGEANQAGVGKESQLEAMGRTRLRGRMAMQEVVVGEIVLSQAADRVRQQPVEGDAPEVVATAADVAEMRRVREGHLYLTEAVPLARDEFERMPMGQSDEARAHRDDRDRAECSSDQAPPGPREARGLDQTVAPP